MCAYPCLYVCVCGCIPGSAQVSTGPDWLISPWRCGHPGCGGYQHSGYTWTARGSMTPIEDLKQQRKTKKKKKREFCFKAALKRLKTFSLNLFTPTQSFERKLSIPPDATKWQVKVPRAVFVTNTVRTLSTAKNLSHRLELARFHPNPQKVKLFD